MFRVEHTACNAFGGSPSTIVSAKRRLSQGFSFCSLPYHWYFARDLLPSAWYGGRNLSATVSGIWLFASSIYRTWYLDPIAGVRRPGARCVPFAGPARQGALQPAAVLCVHERQRKTDSENEPPQTPQVVCSCLVPCLRPISLLRVCMIVTLHKGSGRARPHTSRYVLCQMP